MTNQEFISLKKKFGTNLRKIRDKKGMSLLDLSYNCSLDHSKISKIELGKVNPTLKTIIELAKGLDVSPPELLEFLK